MKKYNLYLWLIALIGLFAACSQDDTADALPADTTDANRVTLTASLPADFVQPQPKSRALPVNPDAASYELRCILEIWDTEAAPALRVRQEIVPEAGDTEINFAFQLANTGTYKALLWADYITKGAHSHATEITVAGLGGVNHYDDGYYLTTNGLKEVQQGSGMRPFLSDAWDAFCGSAEFIKAETALALPKVTLTRPFTRVTIAEKNAARFAACKQVIATFKMPAQFDVATGTVSGERDYVLTGDIQATVGPRLNFGTDVTIGGQTCKTLFCVYLFAGDTDGTMGDIKLEFTATEESQVLPTVTIPAGIPVKRNHRINAAGNLIGEPSSDAVTMTVDINSEWTKPDDGHTIPQLVWDGTTTSQPAGYVANSPGVVEITSAPELAWLAQQKNTFENYTFKLTADIDLNHHEWKPIGSGYQFKGTFDGQNHTVSNMKCTTSQYAGLFGLLQGATVQGVTVSGSVSFAATTKVGYLGGIAGNVVSSTITGCTNRCTVSATGNELQSYVGGIAGNVYNQDNGGTCTLTGNTNTGNVSTNGNSGSTTGGIIGYATSTASGSSITLTGNTYDGGTPSDVCIGMCTFISGGTITIDAKNDATNGKPYPVPQQP